MVYVLQVTKCVCKIDNISISVKDGQGAQVGRHHRPRQRPLLAAPSPVRSHPRRSGHYVRLQAAAGLPHVRGKVLHRQEGNGPIDLRQKYVR